MIQHTYFNILGNIPETYNASIEALEQLDQSDPDFQAWKWTVEMLRAEAKNKDQSEDPFQTYKYKYVCEVFAKVKELMNSGVIDPTFDLIKAMD